MFSAPGLHQHSSLHRRRSWAQTFQDKTWFQLTLDFWLCVVGTQPSSLIVKHFFTICNQKSRRSPATANSMFCFAFLHRVWCLSCDEYGAVDGSDVGSSWSLNWSSRPGVPIFSTPSTHAFSLLQCLHTYRWLDGVNLLGLLE